VMDDNQSGNPWRHSSMKHQHYSSRRRRARRPLSGSSSTIVTKSVLPLFLIALANSNLVNAERTILPKPSIWHRNPPFISRNAWSSSSSKLSYDCSATISLIRGGEGESEEPKSDGNDWASTRENDTTADEIINEDEIINTNDQVVAEQQRNLTFSATAPHDGSAQDKDGLPLRFIQMKKDNREEAIDAFQTHLEWRKENEVDTILLRPHPMFDICKALVPCYFPGRDPHNNIIFIQRPAALDFDLMRKNNATIDDLLNHYCWTVEYCWHIVEPGPPEGVMTSVLDMKGLRFRQMKNQEYIGFGKRFVSMMSVNYPGRSYKTLVINAPKWFHALYKIFKPLLRESTRQKIVILKPGQEQDTALKFYLGDSLPIELVSDEEKVVQPGERYFLPVDDKELCAPGPHSVIEFEMRQLCLDQLKAHNETMQDVL